MEEKQLELFDKDCNPLYTYPQWTEEVKEVFAPEDLTDEQLEQWVVYFEKNKNHFSDEEREFYQKIHHIWFMRGITASFWERFNKEKDNLPKVAIERLKGEKKKDDALYADKNAREDLGNHT